MTYKIAPSILSADFLSLQSELDSLYEGKADLIHYDVMDGKFVPEISYGEPIFRMIKKASKIPVDVHLMVSNPSKTVDSFLKSGAEMITIHVESGADIGEELKKIKNAGAKCALSVKPATPVESVYPYLSILDMVLIMTVEPGFGGQAFMESQLEKIKKLRARANEVNSALSIEVDGGINKETILLVKEAGADVFVAGSAVFKGSVVSNLTELRKIICN